MAPRLPKQPVMQAITLALKDLGGGFSVRRVLPGAHRRSVGPFIFFDHFGPIEAGPDDHHDVRPHPHIGLATVTYLFEGAMQHADSTGVTQRIEPGALNWMTAGRGIVHSERTPADLRLRRRRSHGLQLWAALPEADEAMAPSFSHTPAAAIPVLQQGGATLRLLVGEAWGARSPVPTRSPTLYLDIALAAGAELALPPTLAAERALYAVDAGFELDGERVLPQTMAVLDDGRNVQVRSAVPTRLVLIGGAPLGPRFLWWNFAASRREDIAAAADAWETQPNERFGAVPGETEFIALPPRRF